MLNLDVSTLQGSYKILLEETKDKEGSIVIGKSNYKIAGDEKAVEIFKSHIQSLSSHSFSSMIDFRASLKNECHLTIQKKCWNQLRKRALFEVSGRCSAGCEDPDTAIYDEEISLDLAEEQSAVDGPSALIRTLTEILIKVHILFIPVIYYVANIFIGIQGDWPGQKNLELHKIFIINRVANGTRLATYFCS